MSIVIMKTLPWGCLFQRWESHFKCELTLKNHWRTSYVEVELVSFNQSILSKTLLEVLLSVLEMSHQCFLARRSTILLFCFVPVMSIGINSQVSTFLLRIRVLTVSNLDSAIVHSIFHNRTVLPMPFQFFHSPVFTVSFTLLIPFLSTFLINFHVP